MTDTQEKIIALYQRINNFGRHLNLQLVHVEEGAVTYELEIGDNLLATPHAAHGGVLSAMMDGVLGVAALTVSSKQKKLVATVEFKVNYLSPAYKGDVLVGKGNVLQSGNRIIVSEGEITEKKSGRLVAKAIGTFNAYPFEKANIPDINFRGQGENG